MAAADDDVNVFNQSPMELALGNDLILDAILDQLPSKCILAARLVNHRWNSLIIHKQAKASLGTPGTTIALDSTNIEQYLESITSTGQTHPGLQASVTVHKYKDDISSVSRLFSTLHALIKLIGPDFVSSLSISSNERDGLDWIAAFELIKELSPGLRHLYIFEAPWRSSISKICLNPDVVSFPKLESLGYYAIVKNPALLPQIVNAAPKLRTLHMDVSQDELQDEADYAKANARLTEAYGAILPSSLSQLQDLHLVLLQESTYASSLGKLSASGLTMLKLVLKANASPESNEILTKFFKTNGSSSTLTSLSFLFLYNPRGRDLRAEFPSGATLTEFPKGLPAVLPKLTHFGYGDGHHFSSISCPSFTRLNHLGHGIFGKLSSVCIGFGTILFHSGSIAAELAGIADALPAGAPAAAAAELLTPTWYNNPRVLNYTCFDSVTNLTVLLNESINFNQHPRHGLPKISLLDAANQLHLLFPKTAHLKLDNQIPPTDRNVTETKNVIKSLLLELSELESLELTNYFDDWLCEFLIDSPEIVTNLQSLKTLIIPKIQREFKEIMDSKGRSIGLGGDGGANMLNALRRVQVQVNGIDIQLPNVIPVPIHDENNANRLQGVHVEVGGEEEEEDQEQPQQQQHQQGEHDFAWEDLVEDEDGAAFAGADGVGDEAAVEAPEVGAEEEIIPGAGVVRRLNEVFNAFEGVISHHGAVATAGGGGGGIGNEGYANHTENGGHDDDDEDSSSDDPTSDDENHMPILPLPDGAGYGHGLGLAGPGPGVAEPGQLNRIAFVLQHLIQTIRLPKILTNIKPFLSIPKLMYHLPDLQLIRTSDIFLQGESIEDEVQDVQVVLAEHKMAYPGLTIELI